MDSRGARGDDLPAARRRYFGGTSLLIVVSITMGTVAAQAQGYLTSTKA